MRHLFAAVAASALFAFAQVAAFAAPPALTVNVPVSLKNISRDFGSFYLGCQLTWNETLKGPQYANMDKMTPVNLVDRGFNGTVSLTSEDTNAAQKATQAYCTLNLLSPDKTKGYRPGVDEDVPGANVPAADRAVGPLTWNVTIPLP